MNPYLRKILVCLKYYDEHSDVYDTSEFSKITDHIYISDNTKNIETIKNHKIEGILYLGDDPKSMQIVQSYKKNNIKYEFIQIRDSNIADIGSVFGHCYKFINNLVARNKNVLIQCPDGVSRSPTIVIFYYMYRLFLCSKAAHTAYPLLDTIKFIKSKRSCIEPNRNFIRQLLLEEKKLERIFN